MSLTMRAYQGEDDFRRIRAFLREVLLLNGRRELCWHVARLDYWRWHGIENCQTCAAINTVTFIWETPAGQIGAVLNPENRGEAFLQLHPGWRTPALEAEMLAAAEARLAYTEAAGRRRLRVWADQHDAQLHRLLTAQGYLQKGSAEQQYRRELAAAIPAPAVPLGYAVRALGDVDELPSRSWASWKAFHPDEPDEKYEGWAWYHNIQRMPLYRRDLDIVAVAPNGEIAGFCTVWYDDVTRTAYFEPVGVMPVHQRRGLARAVMLTGLHRLQRLGGVRALVGGYSVEATALYASVAPDGCDVSEPWVKEW